MNTQSVSLPELIYFSAFMLALLSGVVFGYLQYRKEKDLYYLALPVFAFLMLGGWVVLMVFG